MLNKNKYKLFGLIFSIAHVCHGQFFYTNPQIAYKWLETNSGNFIISNDSTNLWSLYSKNRKLSFDENHHFGIYLNIKNKSKDDINKLTQLISSSGGFVYAKQKIDEFSNHALETISEYPDSVYKQSLIDLVVFNSKRNY